MLLMIFLPNFGMGASDAPSPAPGAGNAEKWWITRYILEA